MIKHLANRNLSPANCPIDICASNSLSFRDALLKLVKHEENICFQSYKPGSFGDLKDTDQRPFSEGNATEAARNGVSFTYKSSPYAGSRHGKEMNVSALSQMTKHWSIILADLAFLRTQYLQRHSLKHLKNLWNLWHFACTATSIHAYLVRRSQNRRSATAYWRPI